MASGRTPKGQFAPGTSGNPGGTPKSPAAEKIQARLDAGAYEPTRDGFTSAFTGIGTDERDKRKSHRFSASSLSYHDIAAMWTQDDLFAAAIEKPSQACFARGYEITIADEGSYEDLKEELELELEELGLNEGLEQADEIRRALGGGAVLLGADDGRPLDEPLDLTGVKKLEWVNVLEPFEIAPVKLYGDFNAAKYGKPEYFQVTPMQIGAELGFFGKTPTKARPPKTNTQNIIHESRLIVFEGIKVSKYYIPISDISTYWGSSFAPRFYDALRDFAVACAGLGILCVDAAQPVIAIDGLMEKVGRDEKALRDRFAAIELSRSIARAIIIDSKREKYERQTTNLAGIPEIWDRLALRFCAATGGIPLSRVLGYSPQTLGSADKVEEDQWESFIMTKQTREMARPIRRVAEMKLRTLRQRKLPKKWSVDWLPLKYLSPAEQAELELTQARTDTLQVKNGAIYPDEIRRSRWKGGWSQRTQIREAKKAPGFAAPMPAGVLPGSTPALGPDGKPVPGAPAPQGPNAHSVSGYARRNPAQTAQNPTVGGDTAPNDAAQDAPVGPATFDGFNIVIENPKGSMRQWVDSDGTEGQTKMRYDYGYIDGSLGADGDAVDGYFGPNENAQWVYVVHQMSKSSGFTVYDEDKVMLGFDSANHAHDAYLRQYDDERFFGGMSQMSVEEFRAKVAASAGARIAHGELDEDTILEHLDRVEQRDGKWVVLSNDGAKVLGTYGSEAEAIHRLSQIEMFKKYRDAAARFLG